MGTPRIDPGYRATIAVSPDGLLILAVLTDPDLLIAGDRRRAHRAAV